TAQNKQVIARVHTHRGSFASDAFNLPALVDCREQRAVGRVNALPGVRGLLEIIPWIVERAHVIKHGWLCSFGLSLHRPVQSLNNSALTICKGFLQTSPHSDSECH